MKIKKKSIAAFILGISVLATVSASFAYYFSGQTVDNRLIVKSSEVLLSEVFNPNDKWLPGEKKQKEVCFGNRGETDQVIRFRVVEVWYDNKGTPNNLSDDLALSPDWWKGDYTNSPAIINWSADIVGSDEKWKKIGDWYYLKSKLQKQNGASPTMTGNVIDSVTFSDELSNASPGAVDDFSNKRYSLLVEMETLNVSSEVTKSQWGVVFEDEAGILNWRAAP